jgi:hypothetical protein
MTMSRQQRRAAARRSARSVVVDDEPGVTLRISDLTAGRARPGPARSTPQHGPELLSDVAELVIGSVIRDGRGVAYLLGKAILLDDSTAPWTDCVVPAGIDGYVFHETLTKDDGWQRPCVISLVDRRALAVSMRATFRQLSEHLERGRDIAFWDDLLVVGVRDDTAYAVPVDLRRMVADYGVRWG